jgi:hypothetical protein
VKRGLKARKQGEYEESEHKMDGNRLSDPDTSGSMTTTRLAG